MTAIVKGKITRQDWVFVGVVVLAAALIFVGFYFLGYLRMQASITEKIAELNKTKKELEDAKKLNAGIEQLRKEAREMNRLVDLFEKRLPEQKEIPDLLRRFERLGGELGLRVQLFSLPQRKSGNIDVIPYKAVVFGQFHEIVTFVNLLERDERYFKISDIDIGPESQGVSQATFVLSTFTFTSEPEKKE